MKQWWSLWRYATGSLLNVVQSLACYIVGWHLSGVSSAMPLARAGAMAATLAIGLALYDYQWALKRSEASAFRIMQKFTASLPVTGAASLEDIRT